MNWMISANGKIYDHAKAFAKWGYIDWRQHAKYNVGDIVYIYCTKPYQKVMYKTKVKNNITENKIIEEIVYKDYLKTKRRTRASILKNYFNGTTNKNKFKTKYKIEEAIKNINNEMEDAQKEFSKLFKSNSYEK